MLLFLTKRSSSESRMFIAICYLAKPREDPLAGWYTALLNIRKICNGKQGLLKHFSSRCYWYKPILFSGSCADFVTEEELALLPYS